MARGDAGDLVSRLRGLLPSGWFPSQPAAAQTGLVFADNAGVAYTIGGDIATMPGEAAELETSPVLGGVLSGFANVFAWVYSQLLFVRMQARLATASGFWLDGRAYDYLGSRMIRRPGEPDASLSMRVRKEIVRQRSTRSAVTQVLVDLVGVPPQIFEPRRASDTGGIGYIGMTAGTGLEIAAAGVAGAGGIGSLSLPFQFFVTTRRSGSGGIANVMGIYLGSGWAGGGIGSLSNPGAAGTIEIGSLSNTVGQVSDAEIYAAVLSVIPAASTAWVALKN